LALLVGHVYHEVVTELGLCNRIKWTAQRVKTLILELLGVSLSASIPQDQDEDEWAKDLAE